METYGIQPNSTQIPHIIIREWMPRLKDVELRVLLIVTDQTLGWIENKETGRRKERDWISRGQLMAKAGKGHTAVSKAIKTLVEIHGIIEALDGDSNHLDTTDKRAKNGGRIYYRLNLHSPIHTLFDTRPQSGRVGGVATFRPAHKVDTTKETGITKETNTLRTAKSPSAHRIFIDFWFAEVQKARGIKPIITGMDGKNLQRILKAGISSVTLEQLAVYFLNHRSFKEFAPSISTFLSAGVLNGIQNRMQNREEFWKELDGFTQRRGMSVLRQDFSEQIQKLKANFGVMPTTR